MKRVVAFPLLVVAILVLASCSPAGKESSPTLTSEPAATALPTLPPGAITVGDLITQVDAAWPGVTSMQTTFWTSTASEAGTPPAIGLVTIEEMVMPSNRRVVQITNGTVTNEQVVVDGRIYMKGALVPAAIAPQVDAGTWIEVDPAGAASDSLAAMQIAYLLSPVISPFAGVSGETRALQAIAGGEIIIDGRSCAAYTFGSSSSIDYELTLDRANLPCRLVLIAGGNRNITTYTFNSPEIEITAPAITTPAPD